MTGSGVTGNSNIGVNPTTQVGMESIAPDETNLEQPQPSGRLYSESSSFQTTVRTTGFLDLTSDLGQETTFDSVKNRSDSVIDVEYNAFGKETKSTRIEDVQIEKSTTSDDSRNWLQKANDKHHNWMVRNPIAAVVTSLTGIGGLVNLVGWAVHKARSPETPQTPTTVDPGEKFYKTPQGLNRTCAMHAANAFLGTNTMELDDLKTASKQVQDRQKQDGLPSKPEGKYSGFTVDTVQQAFHNKGIETDSRSFFLQGNNQIAEQLNELSTQLATHDEVMVNMGNEKGSAHWVSFRRDSEGSWHLLDSKTSYNDQPVKDPVAYIRDGMDSGKSNAQVVFKHEFAAPKGVDAGKALAGSDNDRGMIDDILNAIKGGFPDGDVSANELYDALQGMKISARSQGKASHVPYEKTIRDYIAGLGDNFIGQGNINALNEIAATYEAHVHHAGRKVDPEVLDERRQNAETAFRQTIGSLASSVIEFDDEDDFIIDQMLTPNDREIGASVDDQNATVRDRLGYLSEVGRGNGDPETAIKVLEDLREQLLNDPRYENEGFTEDDPWIQQMDLAIIGMNQARTELNSELTWISETLEANDDFRVDV